MNEYSYFISDSALLYSDKCLQLALDLNNQDYILNMQLQKAYLLSFPQLFYESFKILESINPKIIPIEYQRKYFNTYIHVFHNQIRDLNNLDYMAKYRAEQNKYINAYLSIGDKDSLEYLTILAYKYYINDQFTESEKTVNMILEHPDITPEMRAEFLFKVASVILESGKGNRINAEKLLIQASIEYNKLAIKKNPALLYLAKLVLEDRNTELAFKLVNIGMEDVRMFSNSHRYSIAERTHTLIQNTYYDKISQQQTRLAYYSIFISLAFISLIIVLFILYRQNKILNITKFKLSNTNKILEEHNRLKQTYMGRYLTMCSDHITRFEDYKKYIFRKLKTGNYEDVLKSECTLQNSIQHEIDFLFSDFDNTFLELYPNFIKDINLLLQKEHYYILNDQSIMNTELRILALLKLGISDNKTISSFLRITVQTVYNYRSKIKSKAININEFENEVKKIPFR